MAQVQINTVSASPGSTRPQDRLCVAIGSTQLNANAIRIIFDSVSLFSHCLVGLRAFYFFCAGRMPVSTDGLTGGEMNVDIRGTLDA